MLFESVRIDSLLTIELSCIRQLVFELHFFGPMTDPDEIRSLFSMLKGILLIYYQTGRTGRTLDQKLSS